MGKDDESVERRKGNIATFDKGARNGDTFRP